MACENGGGQQHPQSPPAPTLSSQAGCAELYFLRYGHTDRWAHPNGQTTDKCNGHTHASSRAPSPAQHPASGEGPLVPQPGRGDGLCPGMGGLSQPHSSGHRGTQPPTLPQGMASWEGSPTGPGAPPCGQIASSLPHLPLHPLTCHNARPLLQSTRSWGQHAVPPTRCCIAWHHPSSQRELCGSPQDQVLLAHSAGTGKTRPYAKGGLRDACRAQHHVQDVALAASPAWGRPCTPS